MDEAQKAQLRSLGNRISGLRTRVKKEPDNAELAERLAALEAEREAIRGPQPDRAPAKPKPKVENTLGARRALTSRDLRRSNLDAPSIEDLIKHAERFGGAGVPEAAAEFGYGREALTRLVEACDRADDALHRKHHPRRPLPKHGNVEERVAGILGEDG